MRNVVYVLAVTLIVGGIVVPLIINALTPTILIMGPFARIDGGPMPPRPLAQSTINGLIGFAFTVLGAVIAMAALIRDERSVKKSHLADGQ